MANVDCNSEITGFHKTEVTLSKKGQDDMRVRRNAGRTRLEKGLDINKHPQPKEIVSQGSYQMRTMVQDDDCEYDIDDGVYFFQDDLIGGDEKKLMPKAARERICEALKWDGRLKRNAIVKRNCVRQEYPEGYHIDVPVYRIITTEDEKGEKVEYYELASGDEWVKSDARAVTRWYNDIVGQLNAGEPDGSQMRRITKLTKKLARSRKSWKSQTTSGISITKLITDHFVCGNNHDDQSLRETWECIQKELEQSTLIKHPVLEDVNLAEKGDKKVAFFRNCLKDALEILEALDEDGCDRKKAHAVWDDVFNTTYFSKQPDDDNESKKSALLVVTSDDIARRNDGGGRFG